MSTKKKPKATKKSATRKATSRASAKKTTKKAAARSTAAKKKAVAKKRIPAASKRTAKKAVKAAPARKKTTARAKTAVAKKAPAGRVTKKAASGARKKAAPAKRSQAPVPTPRRAIYIDVENTSSKAALLAVIDSLEIDRTKQPVELHAVGNWRAVGQLVARELAGLGAQLVHSAPARGVRDWSDLWIAVAAGGWIAGAAPGDILEIVSNDRAFDAVGDAAAARGVVYRRVQHRRTSAAAAAAEKEEETATTRSSRGARRRRPRRSSKTAAKAVAKTTPTSAPEHAADDPHGASRDQMFELVGRLAEGRPSPWVNLDVLEGALKREGYSRPPNSPRLVTRLRRLKDFEVDSHGRVRIISADEDD